MGVNTASEDYRGFGAGDVGTEESGSGEGVSYFVLKEIIRHETHKPPKVISDKCRRKRPQILKLLLDPRYHLTSFPLQTQWQRQITRQYRNKISQ